MRRCGSASARWWRPAAGPPTSVTRPAEPDTTLRTLPEELKRQRSSLKGYRTLEDHYLTLDAVAGYAVDSQAERDGQTVRARDTYALRDGYRYTFTLTAAPGALA